MMVVVIIRATYSSQYGANVIESVKAVPGKGLRYSLIAQRAEIFALQAIPQILTQKLLPSTPEQWETRFVKP
jgi:hypothetical protein